MAYGSRGNKPFERANKINHAKIINNKKIQDYVRNCLLPEQSDSDHIELMLNELNSEHNDTIRHIIAIDGGYNEAYLNSRFPSSTITYFTFGPIMFSVDDLFDLRMNEFISPDDIRKLKQIQRYSLTVPTRSIKRRDCISLCHTIRKTIFEFFESTTCSISNHDQGQNKTFTDVLRWFLFRNWSDEPIEESVFDWSVKYCPEKDCSYNHNFQFDPTHPNITQCPQCNTDVYITDLFRLHEGIDEELGAPGINGYLLTMLEQFVMITIIYQILIINPKILSSILFIKDGPLAFFGYVAPLHKPMRELLSYLFQRDLAPNLVGVEKSGPFVEHANEIRNFIQPNTFLILDNEYIRRYVVPGGSNIYGDNTYYSQKMIFKSIHNGVYVVSSPVTHFHPYPQKECFPSIDNILSILSEMKCDMYDDSLIPISLANRLVSLSQFPSSRILNAFTKSTLSKNS